MRDLGAKADYFVHCHRNAHRNAVMPAVEAYENGGLVHEKKWDQKIKRELV